MSCFTIRPSYSCSFSPSRRPIVTRSRCERRKIVGENGVKIISRRNTKKKLSKLRKNTLFVYYFLKRATPSPSGNASWSGSVFARNRPVVTQYDFTRRSGSKILSRLFSRFSRLLRRILHRRLFVAARVPRIVRKRDRYK